MNSRKRARRLALQALYAWWVSKNDIRDVEKYFMNQHADEDFDKEYFSAVILDISEKYPDIDDFMNPYLNIPLKELDFLEYNLLRLAVYELQYRPDIPYKVVINEALDLAKTFGAQDSYKFVNGVLDKVSKVVRMSEYK